MRIAFICVDLLQGYQMVMWDGVRNAALDLDIQLICLPGRGINCVRPEDEGHNDLYNFLTSDLFDGYIIAASTYVSTCSMNELSQFCKNKNLPYISVGIKTGNEPTLFVDNIKGLRQMITHYIKDHNLTKFGFISGPLSNDEARTRLKTFKETLQNNNVEVIDEWIFKEGTFQIAEGILGMESIWHARADKPQVVLAANDDMALGAFKYCEENSIKVPHDLKLGGFDNLYIGEINSVPLTTVAQPIYEQGYQSVKLLIEVINKSKVSDMTLSTYPVYRESCGCLSDSIKTVGQNEIDSTGIEIDTSQSLRSNLDRFIKHKPEFKNINLLEKNRVSKYLDNLEKYTEDPNENLLEHLIFDFGQILSKENRSGSKLEFWYRFLSGLRFCYKRLHPESMREIGQLTQKCYILIGEKLFQTLSSKINSQSADFVSMQSSMQTITESRDLKELKERLTNQLPGLKINLLYVSLFNYGKNGDRVNSTLFYEYKDEQEVSRDKKIDFEANLLIPKDIIKNEKKILVSQMLIFEGKPLGIMICDIDDRPGNIFESLRSQISSSIRSGMLLENMKNIQNNLSIQNRKIKEMIEPMLVEIKNVTNISRERIMAIEEAARQMRSNEANFAETTTGIATIAESTLKMKQMIATIDDISEQINVLSINASIESARVGEHGRGFSVISSAIRKLADTTAQTVKRTDEALKIIEKNVKGTSDISQQNYKSFIDTLNEIEALAISFGNIKDKMSHLESQSLDIISIL